MADDEAVYSVELQDNTSGAAESAASALEKLKRQIDGDQKALRAMQAAMRNLQQGTSVNVEQFRKLDAQIKAKKQSVAQAQSAYLALGGGFGRTGKGSQSLAERFNALSKTAQGMPGPLSSIVGQLGHLRGLVAGGLVAAGILAIAAALIALAAAAAAATAALLKYGIAQANARRGELLRLEGLTKMRSWWGIAAGNATEMQQAIDRVNASTTVSRDKLEQWGAQLYRMGLRGENFAQALEAAGIKGSVLGDQGAKSAMQWGAAIAWSGGQVKRLTDDVKARFGGVVHRQMLDLNVQAQKLRENFGALFGDLRIEALLKALHTVTSLFSQSTASGRALRAIFETMLQPLVDVVTSFAPVIKRFFQGIIISTLIVQLAIIRLRAWWKRTFGDSELLTGMEMQRLALLAGVFVVGMLATALGLLVGIFVVMGTVLRTLGGFFFGWLKIVVSVYSAVLNLPWLELGKSLASAIAKGVKSGAAWVVESVKNLGAAAWDAFREKLGIASPSKVFTDLGMEIPAGVERGIEKGSPGAQRAADGMVRAGSKDAAPRSSASQSGGVHIGSVVVHSQATDAKGIADDIEQELRRVLEGVAVQLGVVG